MERNQRIGFLNGFRNVQEEVHRIAVDHGWWETDRSDGEVIALCHSELSEALEAMRIGNPMSEKIPEFTAIEEELADAIIRIMDFAEKRDMLLAGAILAKIEHNRTRPHKHGKEF